MISAKDGTFCWFDRHMVLVHWDQAGSCVAVYHVFLFFRGKL